MSLREDLLRPCDDLTPVTVEGVGGVWVRQLTGADFDFVRGDGTDDATLMARLVIAGVADESGSPVFGRRDVAVVTGMPLDRLRALAEAVQNHCGVVPEDMDELAGNSATTTTSGSGTS